MDRCVDVSRDLEGPLLYLCWCWGGQNVGSQESDEEDDADGCHVVLMLTGSRDEKKGNGLLNRI